MSQIKSNTRTPRIALIGAGYWGRNLARNLAELGALAAICDSNNQTAAAVAAQHNVPTLSFDQALSTATIEAVMIAAPPSLHYAMAEQALHAGKHVFIEKPMASNLSDACKLADLARHLGKQIMVGHLLQYHPVFAQLRQLVTDGALGKLQYVYSNRLGFGKFYPGDDVVWDLAPHDLSMVLSLFGRVPKEIEAQLHTAQPGGLADSATIHLKFPGRVKAHIFVSRLNPFKEHKLTVIGSSAMAVFDDSQIDWSKKLYVCRHEIRGHGPDNDRAIDASKSEPEFIEVEKSEPLRNECQHFINCIVNDSITPLTGCKEALRVMAVLDWVRSIAILNMVEGKTDAADDHETAAASDEEAEDSTHARSTITRYKITGGR